MDKKGNPIAIRLPIGLEIKIRHQAQQEGRSLNDQLIHNLARAYHEWSFRITEYVTTFDGSEEKNG